MRLLKPEVSESRKKKILRNIIYQYINTANPVSSKAIVEDYDDALSSASIRKIMADLEKEGFITHPHTSSGRIPTDKGYRWFVDSIAELQNVAIREREKITEEFNTRIEELDTLFIKTSHLLSIASNYTGFAITPKLDKSKLKNLELIKVSDDKLLVLMITDSSLVKHNIIQVDTPMDVRLLRETSEVLTERFRGVPLREIKYKISDVADEVRQNKQKMEEVLKLVSGKIFDTEEEQLFIDGASNTIHKLEKRDYDHLTSVMKLFDQKESLQHVLEKDIEKLKGVEVTIGRENNIPGLNDLSFIKTAYKINGNPVGVLGIIGPKRMEYSKMMSLVNLVATAVNNILKKISD